MLSHQKIVIGGAHVKNEFDPPSLVHNVEKLDTIMFLWIKIRSSLIDFIILDEFNDMVEQKTSLFLMLPKVFQELLSFSTSTLESKFWEN